MIRRNQNKLKDLQYRNIYINKNQPLRQRTSSHALIYNIDQYRKSITNIAIGCVKKQSVKLNNQNKQIKYIYQKDILNAENNTLSEVLELKGDYNQTKKKKYNYGINLQNQLKNSTKQNYAKDTSLSRYQKKLKADVEKSYSFINRKQDQYITTPFQIHENQQNCRLSHQKNKFSHLSLKNIDQIRNEYKIHKQQELNTLINQENKKIVNNTSYKSINMKKINSKLYKNSVSNSDSLLKEKLLPKPFIPLKTSKNQQILFQSHHYSPKTETYTSRSEYTIQKLSNKLDSYIKKHIKQH